ncbi:MAG: hypothetical protein K8I60_15425 [Anaerolineae bacterium]|nr:hypothetical protein [Anaerolineae bacterium]
MRKITLALLISIIILGFGWALPAAAQSAQCGGNSSYWGGTIVLPGDTWESVARRFKLTPAELQAGNSLTGSPITLTPGELLNVPSVSLNPNVNLRSNVVLTVFTGATFQPFEHGFMIWREDTGDIGVYVNDSTAENSGNWRVYPLTDYGVFPDNPVYHTGDRGIPFTVMFGFGKVWNNMPGVRDSLGWPIWNERGYTMIVQSAFDILLVFTLPDGRQVMFDGGDAAAQYTIHPFNDVSDVACLAIPTPLIPLPEIPSPTPVREVFGAPTPLLTTCAPGSDCGMIGVTLPVAAAVYASPSPTGPAFPLIPSATWTPYIEPPTSPTSPPISLQMVFQPFERGFMVRDAASGCVYAYSEVNQNIILVTSDNYHYCAEFGGLTDNPGSDTPPEGLLNPTGAFGRVWNAYPVVRDGLGYATSAEQSYTGQLPVQGVFMGGAPYDSPVAPLPDGRVLYCGFRAATSGTCNLR